VNFVWLERKVMEWGCMQALIDFDGWRKWKDFSQKAVEAETAKKAAAAKAKEAQHNPSLMTAGSPDLEQMSGRHYAPVQQAQIPRSGSLQAGRET
jgi:hypothetical protein